MPACFWMLLSVPIGISRTGCGTVTRPVFTGCLNCLWLPTCATSYQPSCFKRCMTSRLDIRYNTHFVHTCQVDRGLQAVPAAGSASFAVRIPGKCFFMRCLRRSSQRSLRFCILTLYQRLKNFSTSGQVEGRRASSHRLRQRPISPETIVAFQSSCRTSP
jgi:hypothetical protein